METITTIAIIVWGILSIILFFKVWGMCNDVRKIRQHYFSTSIQNEVSQLPSLDAEKESISEGTPKFSVNQLVLVKQDESQFRISYISTENGVVKYLDSLHQKYYTENEIEDFEKYWEAKKQQAK